MLSHIKNNGGNVSDYSLSRVIETYEKSIEVNPNIRNRAWLRLLDIYFEEKSVNISNKDERINKIIKEHLKQEPYSAATMSAILDYCKNKDTNNYCDKNIFEYLLEAFEKHFPKNYVAHVNIIIDACKEFNQFKTLKLVLSECKNKEELIYDDDFSVILMDVYYTLFRDYQGAVDIGNEFLERKNSLEVKQKLLNIFLNENRFIEAREIYSEIKPQLSVVSQLEREVSILEREGKYQDAIDVINNIPDKRDFDTRYCHQLSYFELKLEEYNKARTRLKNYLEERSFSTSFGVEIINFEFASLKTGKSVKKTRLNSVIQSSANKDIIAIAHFLSGDEDKAWEILKDRAENDFSKLKDYQRWPVLHKYEAKLKQLEAKLRKAKRTLDDL